MEQAKHTAVIERQHPAKMGGTQHVYRFDNGYGASIVRFPGSYGSERGLYELAVIRFHGEDNDSFSLVYDTHITDDVMGHLSWDEAQKTLDEIAALRGSL